MLLARRRGVHVDIPRSRSVRSVRTESDTYSVVYDPNTLEETMEAEFSFHAAEDVSGGMSGGSVSIGASSLHAPPLTRALRLARAQQVDYVLAEYVSLDTLLSSPGGVRSRRQYDRPVPPPGAATQPPMYSGARQVRLVTSHARLQACPARAAAQALCVPHASCSRR